MRIEGRLLLWLIPAVMLLVAVAPWPYGYYQLLRVVVCISCGVLAYQSYERDGLTPWTIGLAIVAAVFNPIVPVHLTREIWAVLNVAAASILLGHMYTEQGRKP